MEYDTNTMYAGQNNFEKYQTAGETLREINSLIDDMERGRVRTYTLTDIGFFMSIPVINIWAPLDLSVLAGVAGYSIYDTFFRNRDKLKKYYNLREQFAEEEVKFRHQWMQESFSNASGQTDQNGQNDNARRAGPRGTRGNQERQQRYSSSSGYNSSTKSYGPDEQRGTFKSCVTVKDVKKVYREKAKKHHPDVGGDEEIFKALGVQYERALEIAQRAN